MRINAVRPSHAIQHNRA